MRTSFIPNRDISISHLREFIVLAQVLNFTKAASELNIAQATLSRHMSSLEKAVGCTLISRTTGGSKLTENGRAFLKEANHIVQSLDSAMGVIATNGAPGFALNMGGHCHQGAYEWITKQLYSYHQRQARVEFTYLTEKCLDNHSLLRDSEANVLLMYLTEDMDLSSFNVVPAFRDRISVAVAANHPLAQNEEVSLNDLCKYELKDEVGYSAYGIMPRIRELCASRDIEPNVMLSERKSYENGLSMDAFSPMPIPSYTAKFYPMLLSGCIVSVPVSDEDAWLNYAFLYREEQARPFVRQFIDELLEKPLPEGLVPWSR